jgi:ADP-ribose pyrophosphatase YjhB (NUDIX family)
MLKDYCPGYFDPTPGGVVAAGESYEHTNTREVEEEMGINGVEMSHLFTFFYEDDR